MRGSKLLLLTIAACTMSQRRWQATPAQLAPMPPMKARATTAVGPLALDPGAGSTTWNDAQRARAIAEAHYLDRPRIHEETAAVLALVDAFFQPLTSETKIGFDQAHHELSTLENLAPYSVANVTLAFLQSMQRLDVCVIGAGIMGPCDRDRAQAQAVPTQALFEVADLTGDIGLLVVRDLHDAGAPGWRGFTQAASALSRKRGIVIDMRDAAGTDPRALWPWVLQLTGRHSLSPLRAIERPTAADAYVAAYRARFSDTGRDAAVWRAFLGSNTKTVAGTPTPQPIEIIVGPRCDAACELVTRVLETYAGAIVIGGVGRAGRVARDEPAVIELPHSQTSIYFRATRYLLNAEIEAATGPSEEWHAMGGDFADPGLTASTRGTGPTDFRTFAIREMTQRLAHPQGWPRCDSLAVPARIEDGPKLSGVGFLMAGHGTCREGYEITIESDVPASALRRFLGTCSVPAQITGFTPGRYSLHMPGTPSAALLAQIAASELVSSIRLDCVYPSAIEPND